MNTKTLTTYSEAFNEDIEHNFKIKDLIKLKRSFEDTFIKYVKSFDSNSCIQDKHLVEMLTNYCINEFLTQDSFKKDMIEEIIEYCFCLEKHQYAPELNKLHFEDDSLSIKVPNCTTFEECKEFLFKNHWYSVYSTLIKLKKYCKYPENLQAKIEAVD